MSKTTDIPAQTGSVVTAPTTVTLDSPIARGDQLIASLHLRRPKAGELRGVSLVELTQMEVGAIAKVLPRICDPFLTADDINKLEAPDLLKIGTEIALFLLPKDVSASLAA
ncbi:MAG TPA: phage tail assembly protein [Rhodanobacter sp.]|jgi:hypothetical protein|nr:phage tail assembly protein [Rhodanobacter sp.]